MKKLHWINAFGLLLLGILCLLQWRENASLHRQVQDAKAETRRLNSLLAQLELDKKALAEDLDSFRLQLSAKVRSSGETHLRLGQIEGEKSRLLDNLAELRQQVLKWQNASKERETRIAALDQNLIAVSAEREQTAALYRAILTRLEESQKLLQERTELYNQLVEQLNAKP